MEDFVDAYAVLGVSHRASQDELKAAHRALVRRHHPDVVPPAARAEATDRMRGVNVAYGLVRDREARAAYDRLRRLHAAQEAAAHLRSPVDDDLLAAQWARASHAAGRWAGTWLRRNRGVTYRAGRAFGRWLS